jgi:transposase-like protein
MLGLRRDFKVQEVIHFSESEKRQIIEDYLQSGETKQAIWQKYTGRREEHGIILRWMREYGYYPDSNGKRVVLVRRNSTLSNQEVAQEMGSEFENLQLKKRILELEKQLQESEMKSIAFETMIEIAERELNISIRKKFNTKPSKK